MTASTLTRTCAISSATGVFGHRAHGADAGVVDQDVDGQPAAVDLVEQAGAGGGIGDVAGDHLDADAAGEFVGQLAQPVLAAGDQRDAVAAGGQLAGDVGADARRGPGDDGGAGGRGSRKGHALNLQGFDGARPGGRVGHRPARAIGELPASERL